MPSILKQRNFLATKIFEITDKSLRFQQKTPFSYIENEFTFEELDNKVVHHKKPYMPTIIAAILAFLITILFLCLYIGNDPDTSLSNVFVALLVCVLFLALSYLINENNIKIYLFNGLPLSFYGYSRSKPQVMEFINSLFAEQKKYLINRYAKYDPYLSVEQINTNLKWLWDRKIIDDDELNDLRSKLLPKQGNNESVGFRINPSSN